MTDEWTTDVARVTDSNVLEQLRRILQDETDLIVEHRFLRGGRAPHRFVCSDFGVLTRYLATETAAGDSFYFWRFDERCSDATVALTGKVPDRDGRAPRGGAY